MVRMQSTGVAAGLPRRQLKDGREGSGNTARWLSICCLICGAVQGMSGPLANVPSFSHQRLYRAFPRQSSSFFFQNVKYKTIYNVAQFRGQFIISCFGRSHTVRNKAQSSKDYSLLPTVWIIKSFKLFLTMTRHTKEIIAALKYLSCCYCARSVQFATEAT